MSKSPGKIYDLTNGRYGIARNDKQAKEFTDYKRVFLEVYLDRGCTIPEQDPNTGKNYVTLKHITQIIHIGFVD